MIGLTQAMRYRPSGFLKEIKPRGYRTDLLAITDAHFRADKSLRAENIVSRPRSASWFEAEGKRHGTVDDFIHRTEQHRYQAHNTTAA